MTFFIDRRLNPKGKSLANRQRFLRRARAQIREAVQKSLKDSGVAGIATSGSPTQINLIRTMRNSFGRRLALKRPTLAEIKALEEEIVLLEGKVAGAGEEARLLTLKAELGRLTARRKWVAFIDPLDV